MNAKMGSLHRSSKNETGEIAEIMVLKRRIQRLFSESEEKHEFSH